MIRCVFALSSLFTGVAIGILIAGIKIAIEPLPSPTIKEDIEIESPMDEWVLHIQEALEALEAL